MKIGNVFQGIKKVFLDTAPVIYYVEATPGYAIVAQEVFKLLSQGSFEAVVSPVTLAECLVIPIRLGQAKSQQDFIDMLTNTDEISFVPITAAVSQEVALMRVRYGLKLPDALQVATALVAGCDAFLTNDAALQRVTELRIVVLGALEI